MSLALPRFPLPKRAFRFITCPGVALRIRIRNSYLITIFLLLPLASFAQTTGTYPPWWTTQRILTGTNASDYSAANQGQAKNIALGAINELYTDLAGFPAATAHLDSLATYLYTSGTATGANDFTAVNLGQLKFLTQPIYDALLTVSATNGPLTSGTYPWAPSASPPGSANDYSMANLGQLKYLFSFDPTLDTNSNGLPDWWENYYAIPLTGTAAISGTSYVLWSGTALTFQDAYQQGLNPIDYYNGHTPLISIVSGNMLTGSAGGFIPAPLVVSVTDSNSTPLIGAPVTFTVTSGGGQLHLSYMIASGTSASLLTDQNGQARIFFQLPAITSATCQIAVSAGPPSTPAGVTFSEMSDNGSGGPYASPFAPSNVNFVLNSDHSIDVSWQNNTDNPADIPIYLETSGTGGWTQVATAVAGQTSVHIPPQ